MAEHIAILRKSNIKKGDDLLGDILSGNKTIESRWYVNKIAPWDRIKKGETVYFKESGCPVTAKAKVKNVIQYGNLSKNIVTEIITKYGKQIAPSTSKKDFIVWAEKKKNKRYCILVFLKNVEMIEPFEIDKTGYGISSAWLITENVNRLRKLS